MKVLFHIGYPLAWASGGHATQIRRTFAALRKHGIEVNWLHEEDEQIPESDIIHFWSRPPSDLYWKLAQHKGLAVVISECLQTSVLHWRLMWQLRGAMRPVLAKILGPGLWSTLGLGIYQECDAAIAVTSLEARYMVEVFGSRPGRTHVVPNGADDDFFEAVPDETASGRLLCVGYISPRKRSVETARAARNARVPMLFVGAGHESAPDYTAKFKREVDGVFVQWLGEVRDSKRVASLMKGSLGLVLASGDEGLPLCVLESLATGKPVMVTRLPNVHSYFGDAVRYCHPAGTRHFQSQLRQFYEDCSTAKVGASFPVMRWNDVGMLVAKVYENVLEGKN